ncbi:MAG: acyl-CoA thioesterase [Tenacibaculum sp.]|nr:acyl-CoA thioesterase [Tenacibaculum sp.]
MTHKYKNAEDSTIEISELMRPSCANFSGKVNGGYILNLMDQIAFACASKYSETYCVTASVDTVNFLKPIEVGELVTMKASINYVGKSSMVVGIRVEAQNIQTGIVKHCNSSYFTMVAKNDDGKSVSVPGLILSSESQIRRFLETIKRIEIKHKWKKEFDEDKFVLDAKHIKVLESYNVQVNI